VRRPEEGAAPLVRAAWKASTPDEDGPVGESLDIRERVVVSPALGVFRPAPPPDPHTSEPGLIQAGALLGWVDDEEVRSPFSGQLMGMLVPPGMRIGAGEPVAWLRT
jgi:biotin carboxyl carrier protein